MSDISKIIDALPMQIIERQNNELIKEFTTEEIELALKGMHPTKARGLDGYERALLLEVSGYCWRGRHS